MIAQIDLACSLVLAAVTVVIILAYAVRASVRGAAKYARVDKNGSSAMLGKTPMEMTYWALQPVARACIAVRLTANAITMISLFLGGVTGVAIAYGHFGVAAIASTVSSLSDALDGLVARMTGEANDAGEVFDAAVDRYVELFLFGGLAVYYREQPIVLVMVMAALAGSFMVSYGTAKAEALKVEAPRGAMRRTERAFYLGLGVALVPFGEAWVMPRFGLWAAHAPLLLALLLVGVVANVSAVRRLRKIAAAVAPHPPLEVPLGEVPAVDDDVETANVRSALR